MKTDGLIHFNRETQSFRWDDVVLPYKKAVSLYRFMCDLIKSGDFKPEKTE